MAQPAQTEQLLNAVARQHGANNPSTGRRKPAQAGNATPGSSSGVIHDRRHSFGADGKKQENKVKRWGDHRRQFAYRVADNTEEKECDTQSSAPGMNRLARQSKVTND